MFSTFSGGVVAQLASSSAGTTGRASKATPRLVRFLQYFLEKAPTLLFILIKPSRAKYSLVAEGPRPRAQTQTAPDLDQRATSAEDTMLCSRLSSDTIVDLSRLQTAIPELG
jgi:predicted polyphosphate/ATP-dependent NAD kinase